MATTHRSICWTFFALSLISLATALILGTAGYWSLIGPATVILFAALAVAFMGHAALRGVAFTVWVLAFVSASMFYPSAFGKWYGVDLKILIVPLIQIIMFGMGTTLSVRDFTRVLAMPWPVFVGMVLQFSVMPMVGLSIASLFGFEPEIAAGVILVGSVPGGVASNLMAYLSRGDVALSVTMTACSTLLSPVMTPLMMKVLAGRLVPIDFWEMMLSILDMVIVPTLAGLVANKILYSRAAWLQRLGPVAWIAVASSLAAAAVSALNERVVSAVLSESATSWVLALRGGALIGLLLLAAVAAAKLVVSILLRRSENWMDRALPVVSMAGICFIIAIITSRSREQLLTVGLALIAAAVLQNTTGYVLGYWGAKLLRLSETACRTVAIEVGLQNGGMASGLAINVLQSPSAALAPAIFGPWMNVSGSVLATWWHRRPVQDKSGTQEIGS
ncbi:MAG TPA: bile acid:sodium symporter family protein [Candidatus Anammoximicrobium sp.]|nr:bile acid:sodium symporter family protein [Candidatus Anammoximicrobium sp.]